MPPRGNFIPVLDKPRPGGNQTRDSNDNQTYGIGAHGRVENPLHGGPRLCRGRYRHHDTAHGQKRGFPGHKQPQHIAEYLSEIRPGEGVRCRVGFIRGPAKVQQPAAQRRNAVYQVPDDGSKQPHSVHQPGKARGQSFQHSARDLSQGRAKGFPGRGRAGHFVAREQAEQTGKRLHEFGHCQTHGHKNNVDARKGIGKCLAESLEHRLDTVHHAGNRGHKSHQSGGLDLRGQLAPDFSAAVLERAEYGKHASDRQRYLVPAFMQVIRHAAEIGPVCGIKQPQHGNDGIDRRAQAQQRGFCRGQRLGQHRPHGRKEPDGGGKPGQRHHGQTHGGNDFQERRAERILRRLVQETQKTGHAVHGPAHGGNEQLAHGNLHAFPG